MRGTQEGNRAAWALIPAGILINEITVGELLCADGRVTETHDRLIILLFQFAAIGIGILLVSGRAELKGLVRNVIPYLASFALTEILLQAVAFASPTVDWILLGRPTFMYHDELLYNAHPGYPGNDEYGFRNGSLPDSPIDIIAYGDSQTFGLGIESERKWSSVLGDRLHRTVYNVSCPGWGPHQAITLLPFFEKMNPKMVLFGLYSGNDMFDAYTRAWADGRLPDLRTSDPDTVAGLRKADAMQTLRDRFHEMADRDPASIQAISSLPLLWRELAEEIKLVGLVRMLVQVAGLTGTKEKPESPGNPARIEGKYGPNMLSIEAPDLRTVFQPVYRFTALDLNDIRIREGWNITALMLDSLNKRLAVRGIAFKVLLIPTKEFAYHEAVAGATTDPVYWRMVRNESAFWFQVKKALEEMGIQFVDGLPNLRSSLAEGRPPYPDDQEGHPNAFGHQALAAAAAEAL